MASDNSFSSLYEMKQFFKNTYNVTGGLSTNSTNTAQATSRRANDVTKTKARQVANKLQHDIRVACSAPPFNLHNIFDQMKIDIGDKGVITVSIPFSEAAYKKSMFKSDSHYSFIPVLMDKGWTTKFAQTMKVKNLTKPSLAYFVGTGELTRVINSFNKAYASHGYRATLNYDEDMLGWIPGHYKTSL